MVLSDRVQHPFYKAQEIGGFIFAYLVLILHRYCTMICFSEKTANHVGAGHDFCNWLQRAENSVDQTHLVALHAPEYPHMGLAAGDRVGEDPLWSEDLHACAGRDKAEARTVFLRTRGIPQRAAAAYPDHAIRFRADGRHEYHDLLAEILPLQ